ncbi:MAG TPA: EAL domain-containing protein [Acidimicrobiales bacterium]|nr:EAL domain-containing protein [Acidimicrobiales bacterium]
MRQQAWKSVLAVGGLLTAAYFALPSPSAQNVLYSLLGFASVVGILVGVRWHHPVNRLGWYFIAAAGACFTLGDDVWDMYGFMHIAVPFPSYADALYLAGYPFLFAGLLRLTRDAERAYWREENTDAAIVSIGVLAISWQFLLDSFVHDPSLSVAGLLVNMAYPIMDVALIFILFRSILFRPSRNTYLNFLAAAMLTMFIGDFVFDLLSVHQSYTTGNVVDAFFLLEYVLVAVAAMHPSVAEDTVQTEAAVMPVTRIAASSRNRLPAVLVAAFVPPAILVVATLTHSQANVLSLSLLCIVVLVVIGVRLKWMVERMAHQSRQLEENLVELTVAHLHRDDLEANLRHQALHDPLTGLANRMLFEDRFTQARERSRRANRLDAVLMLDLDEFKEVNDAFGHLIGDQMLVAVSHRLEKVTRSSDTLCRFGGDEFLYLAEGLENREEAEVIGKRLIESLVEPFDFGDIRCEQRASVGIVICETADDTASEYFRDADAAMYEAKRNHKGHYVVFTPSLHNEALSVFTLAHELRTASHEGDLTMHYQPIVDLASERVVGFEALMRWPHPQRGWVSPEIFIPIAEQSELIVELGNFSLHEAAAAARSWEKAEVDGGAPFVTVNLSPGQLHDENLIQVIKEALSINSLDPNQFMIEITERAAMLNIDDTLEVIGRLHNLGVGIALDDFGTGYSSLSYITLLRPKIIKIDQSFVAAMDRGHDGGALLAAIVSLGHNLGITMLAEGIETTAQFKRLQSLGCQLGQGFLFSAAVPAVEVPSLIGTVVGRN